MDLIKRILRGVAVISAITIFVAVFVGLLHTNPLIALGIMFIFLTIVAIMGEL